MSQYNPHGFKLGDQVICVDSSASFDQLKAGNIYTVEEDRGYVYCVDGKRHYNISRFTPLDTPIEELNVAIRNKRG